MKKKFRYLNKHERNQIQLLWEKGYSMRRIAHVLERSPNTVSYELKRVVDAPYTAKLGQQYARTKLKNRRLHYCKLNRCNALRNYVITGLENGWSPDEIAGRMKHERKPWYVSRCSIYHWLYSVRGQGYVKYLYGRRFKRRRHRKRGNHGKIRDMRSIHERPKVLGAGHWETDLVVSSRCGSGALSTSNELKSRYLVVHYVPDRKASSKQKALHRLEREFNVKSIAFDRGHENARHYECSSKTYFCDPYSSYQRGANENQNKLLRRYFPKGTDFSTIPLEDIQTVVSRINEKPRKILGYRTATEVATEMGLLKSSVLIEG